VSRESVNGGTVKNAAYFFVALLGLVVFFLFGAELFTLTARILKNYNEGWNAYHIAAAIENPATLYPPSAALMTNNYPPLSFFLVGAVAKLTGDAIIAGRIVSFACALGTGFSLMLAARAMGCAWRQSVIAGLLFWAAPWVIVRFTGMNDPQMLGNFLDAAALVAILTAPRDVWHIAVSALFLTLAEFVKPLFVTLPLALMIWLLVHERRSAFLLAAFGIVFALIGYVLSALLLDVELLHYILSPRVFLWSKLTGQPGQWLLVEALPFAASLALFRMKESFAFFAALYAALAFALSLFFSGGDGVSASQMMDVDMAVALGAALYLHHVTGSRWTFPVLGFTVLLQGVLLVLSFQGLFLSRPSLTELMGARDATEDDIALLAHRADPVMCESLALCYWAGRKPEIDAFALRQSFATGARPESDLTKLLDRRAFSLVQLQPASYFSSPSALSQAIARNYYLEHQDKNGLFLLPRNEPLSGAPRVFGR
jgi:hypothetical protein